MGAYDDWWKDREERRRASILEKGEWNFDSNVYCPHCAEEIDNDEGQFSSGSPGNWETYECPFCEKEFEHSWDIEYSTRRNAEE